MKQTKYEIQSLNQKLDIISFKYMYIPYSEQEPTSNNTLNQDRPQNCMEWEKQMKKKTLCRKIELTAARGISAC